MRPISSDDIGPTKPEAGVMATSPATAPEIAPSALGLPLRSHSAPAHPSTPAAAPNCVATKALLARLPAVSALPALKPNQPTHSRQAPMKLSTTLCGGDDFLRIAKPLAQIERADQRRDSRRDVDHGAAGEIERRELAAERGVQQAALAPDHVRHAGSRR